jgi:hypothetical protein
MRVMEQVIQDGKTTYKKVATRLIEILKKDGGHLSFTQEQAASDDIEDSDSAEISDPVPGKKKNQATDKSEKNIRRRVYDALNV